MKTTTLALCAAALLSACSTFKIASPTNQIVVDATVSGGAELVYNAEAVKRGVDDPSESFDFSGLNLTSERKALLGEIEKLSHKARAGFTAGKLDLFTHDICTVLAQFANSLAMNMMTAEKGGKAVNGAIALPKSLPAGAKQLFSQRMAVKSSQDEVVAVLSAVRDVLKALLNEG